MAFNIAVVYRSDDPSGYTTVRLVGVDDTRRAYAEECAARVQAGEPPAGGLPLSSASGVTVSVPWSAVQEIRIEGA